MNLNVFFRPRSIAVIGASANKKKVGHAILRNIIESGFSGEVYPIHRQQRRIMHRAAYASVVDVPGDIDVAVIAIPAPSVIAVLKECGKKKIPFVVVISSGFSESSTDGERLERRLTTIAEQYRITLLGPNCLGYLNAHANLNASFAADTPRKGSISFVSQSGAILVSLIDWALEAEVGVSKLVSLGNAAGLTETEVVSYLASDDETGVIGMYLEEISNLKSFMDAVAKCKKPVVIFKAGHSAESRSAVRSHTGSIATDSAIVSGILEQAGAHEVADLEELFYTLRYYAVGNANDDPHVLIVTNAGGPGIVALDALSYLEGVLVAQQVSPQAQKELERVLPPGAGVRNPIDIVGDADLARLQRVMKIVTTRIKPKNTLIIMTPQAMTPLESMARYICELQRDYSLGITVSFIGGRRVLKARRILDVGGVFQIPHPHDALRIMALSKKIHGHAKQPQSDENQQQLSGGATLKLMPYEHTQRILLKSGLPLERGIVATRVDDVARFTKYPAAMKVLARGVIHKKREGGVKLNICDEHQAALQFSHFQSKFEGQGFRGVVMQSMRETGVEFFIGARRDPSTGIVILFGLGGTLVEELSDVVIRSAPLTRSLALNMIDRLRNQTVLASCDRNFILNVLMKTSRLMLSHQSIQELDLNPVSVYTKGGSILDARLYAKID